MIRGVKKGNDENTFAAHASSNSKSTIINNYGSNTNLVSLLIKNLLIYFAKIVLFSIC